MVLAILSLLAGTILGQRFKILVMAPAILFTLVAVVAVGAARDESQSVIGLTAVAGIACLQIGYLLGLGLQHLLILARASRWRAASLANSLRLRRSAH